MSTTTGTRIRYMGNKLALSRDVAALVSEIDADRPLVDLFGGMCTIAGAVSPSGRRVVVNDVQQYARLVAQCLVTARASAPSVDDARAILTPAYEANRAALATRFARALAQERRVLTTPTPGRWRAAQERWRHAGNDGRLAAEVAALRARPEEPHRLITLTFAWGYFGLRQAVELDSLRAAIDQASTTGELAPWHARWCRLALLQTASRIASSPGHFAQFLQGSTEAGLRRIIAARRRSATDAFFDDLARLRPYGTSAWRRRNRVFAEDALALWPSLDRAYVGPAVFYADPPYSKEHYSRFYHVLETLERYDYPDAVGRGRYRPDRFWTPMATKTGVASAMSEMCRAIADRDGVLVLSYPSSGLLTRDLGLDPAELLSEHFGDVRLAISSAQRHSTLGARHGAARQRVTEFVWIAKRTTSG